MKSSIYWTSPDKYASLTAGVFFAEGNLIDVALSGITPGDGEAEGRGTDLGGGGSSSASSFQWNTDGDANSAVGPNLEAEGATARDKEAAQTKGGSATVNLEIRG